MTGIVIRQIRPGDGPGCARAWRDAGRYYASLVPEVIHDGLDLVAPGLVPISRWRPDPSPFPPAEVETLGGVARKS